MQSTWENVQTTAWPRHLIRTTGKTHCHAAYQRRRPGGDLLSLLCGRGCCCPACVPVLAPGCFCSSCCMPPNLAMNLAAWESLLVTCCLIPVQRGLLVWSYSIEQGEFWPALKLGNAAWRLWRHSWLAYKRQAQRRPLPDSSHLYARSIRQHYCQRPRQWVYAPLHAVRVLAHRRL